MTYVEHGFALERGATIITDNLCIGVLPFDVLAYVRERVTIEVTDPAFVVSLTLVSETYNQSQYMIELRHSRLTWDVHFVSWTVESPSERLRWTVFTKTAIEHPVNGTSLV